MESIDAGKVVSRQCLVGVSPTTHQDNKGVIDSRLNEKPFLLQEPCKLWHCLILPIEPIGSFFFKPIAHFAVKKDVDFYFRSKNPNLDSF